MLLDIDKIDSNIVYDNFYLNYFKKKGCDNYIDKTS